MPWPVPAPGVIAARAAGVFETALPGIDARSDNTGATAICRVTELGVQDLYYEQGYLAEQLMPDTATDWLPRHGQIWGVPRDQPTFAAGNVVLSGLSTGELPVGTQFQTQSATPVIYQTTAAVTLGTNVSIPVQALVLGSGGNLAAGTVLYPVSPISEISPQSATVDANGITGGLDLESLDSWRQRILERIRLEPAGGSSDDYVAWATAAIPDVAFAACPASLAAGGSVTVVVAMSGPRVPTATELADITTYIAGKRPITATFNVVAATLQPVDVSLQVRPNTVAIQQAASAALSLFFAGASAIGEPIYYSSMSGAIEYSDGETYHELLAPTADVQPTGPTALPVLGTVTFS
jgi:uncharacterized phage protein gp47/JayE